MNIPDFVKTTGRRIAWMCFLLFVGFTLARTPAQAQAFIGCDNPSEQTDMPTAECEALVALYNSTDGANSWNNDTDYWLSTNTPCTWFGISCTGGGNVKTLGLADNGLDGNLPTELGALTSLTNIFMNSNSLTGSIPSDIGALTSLTTLGLANNNLSGPIPDELWDLTSLKNIFMNSNSLTGSIPSDIGALTSLTTLGLANNNLSGPIPDELWGLTSLKNIFLGQNENLSGSIPSTINALTDLQRLELCNNSMTGSIPPELGDLSNLTHICLGQNQFTGEIPPQLGNLENLEQLRLGGNLLTGGIPPDLGNLENLQWLTLYDNALTGEIPLQLGNLQNLTHLWLYGNQLDGPIPSQLGNLDTNLEDLLLGSNNLSNIVPLAVAQVGADINCNFTSNAASLCVPDDGSGGDYTAAAALQAPTDEICGLQLDPECSDELPVELTAFEAIADGDAVLLRWSTASETNNAGFEVQHERADIWEVTTFIEGHGTTLDPQSYTFRVANLLPGQHRFRLKQIDFDGTFEYSPEVELGLAVGIPEAFHLSAAYPNPFNPETTFSLSVARSQRVRVAVYDVLGRQVALMHDGPFAEESAKVFRFEAANLPSGLYTIFVKAERFTTSQQILLTK